MLEVAYIFLSFFSALGAVFHNHVSLGGITALASFFSIVGPGGSILALRSSDYVKNAGAILIGLPLIILTYWMSAKFYIGIFGYQISGLTWVLLGWFCGVLSGFSLRP